MICSMPPIFYSKPLLAKPFLRSPVVQATGRSALPKPPLLSWRPISMQPFLKIAGGTGCGRKRIQKPATSILATDINAAVLEIAKSKAYAPATVTFELADIFQLPTYLPFESLFGGFIWSHIPLQQMNDFL